jgi:hypothetical protein
MGFKGLIKVISDIGRLKLHQSLPRNATLRIQYSREQGNDSK